MKGRRVLVVGGEKVCTQCGLSKPLSKFGLRKTGSGGRKAHCRECLAASERKRNHKNIATARTKWRAYAARHKDQRRSAELRRRHGISLEQYDAMFTSQLGCCAICRYRANLKRSLCVDHCHKTGRIRGLLCDRCNLIVGWVEQDSRYAHGLNSYAVLDYCRQWGIL